MATIKLQPSGAVVLKDGKVACTCCAQPPTGCCPYPAQALVDGLYSVADLPDEILLNNANLDLFDKVFAKTGGSISFYEATQNGELMSVRINTYIDMQGIERIVWILLAYGEEFGLSSNPFCLISGEDEANPSKDTFASSYTVTGPPGGPVIVTRQSLCVWTGPDTCGNEVRLEFFSYAEENDYPYWFIGWLEYFGPVGDCNVLDSSSGVKDPYAQGGDGIDTPVGSYGPSYSVS